MSTSNNNKRRNRKCKRGSGEAKINVIRIKYSVRSDLQFIECYRNSSRFIRGRCDWESHKDVQAKKIGQLSSGKDLSIQLNTEDMVTLFKDKEKENNKRLWIFVQRETIHSW
jgi:hypothetical protein